MLVTPQSEGKKNKVNAPTNYISPKVIEDETNSLDVGATLFFAFAVIVLLYIMLIAA